MYVKEFAERVQSMADHIGCDGNGSIGSHQNVKSKIFIECINEIGEDYEFVDFDIDTLFGCQCPSGIILKIRKIKK